MASSVRVLVLRAPGINCDEETMHAWRLAGGEPSLMHINALAERPRQVEDYDIITVPGGFSYGDDIAAGQILAQRIVLDLADHLHAFVERGGGLLGICNGFQVLVKAGLLPGGAFPRNAVTITTNDSAKFEARWVRMKVCTDRCVFLTPGSIIEMPVEHGEGRVFVPDTDTVKRLDAAGQVAVRYVDADGRQGEYPANPNGSTSAIAGLCDPTGRVFGMMPHPERYFDRCHHPLWTRRPADVVPDGLTVYTNAVQHFRKG